MKITYRVPTRQYAYIEVERELPDAEESKIVEVYFDLEDEYNKQKEERNNVPFSPNVHCGAEGSKSRDDYLKKQ
jgi:hypothetical protein